MKPSELLELLREFYADKAALVRRHEIAATLVQQYEFNNVYQYVIAREDVQLSWLAAAIEDLGGSPPELEAPPPGPRMPHAVAIFYEDARLAQAYVDRWRERVEQVDNARHQGMLRIILGETLEHKRFFEQAAAGRTDLLGRHTDSAGSVGVVLPTRWVGD